MTLSVALGAAALALFAVFAVLGKRVSNKPLGRLDEDAVYFRAQITPLALVFTISGRSRAMTAACLLAITVYAALRLPRWVPLVVTASQIISQTLVEFIKTLYRRIRPDYWLVGLEAGHSYPSGHATTATVFFLGWAVIAAFGTLPVHAKAAIDAALALWAAGIMWSRLALGAHYLSDVCGGVLFGAAWICGALAILAQLSLIPR